MSSDRAGGRPGEAGAALALGGALAVLLGLMVYAHWVSRQSEESARWVSRTHEVSGTIRVPYTELREAQSVERGFVLTGEEKFLAPYAQRWVVAAQAIAELRQLMVDPDQLRRLDALEPRVAAVREFFDESIRQRRELGFEMVRARILTGEGIQRLARVRAVTDEMEAAQDALLVTRAAAMTRLSRQERAAELILFPVVLLLGAWGFCRFRHEAAQRQAAALRQQAIIEAAPNGMVLVDEAGHIVLVNAQMERLFGYARAELLGQPIEMLMPERFRPGHPALRSGFMTQPHVRAMGSGRDLAGRRKDGSCFPVEIGLNPITMPEGEHVLASIIDISARKAAQDQLQRANAELARSNGDLTDFASIVAHDLKAPVRAIGTLAKWLHTDHAASLGAEGLGQLDELIRRAKRMDAMIEGILHYSQVGRAAEHPEAVPVRPLLEHVLADLAPPAHVRVTLAEPFPTLTGDPAQVRQVFQNLLGNAIKHADKPQVAVRVACADRGAEWEFSVADNGPGIEGRHYERIFKMFQTLAPKDKTDSTGIGLALVKRIVERAGGRVWVESRVGEGSTFCWTWPKPPPKP